MKTWVITPFFCKESLMTEHLNYIKRERLLGPNMQLVVVNEHYPIENGADRIRYKVADLNGIYLDPGKNLGMQAALNFALKEIAPGPNDVIILSDADDRAPEGAYEKLSQFITLHQEVGIAALSVGCVELNRNNLKPIPRIQMDQLGVYYWTHPGIDMWHIAAYRAEWIQSIGGFGQTNPYWGGLEAYLQPHLNQTKKSLVYLTQYLCIPFSHSGDPDYFDLSYRTYKNEIHQKGIKDSFETWLKSNS